MSDQVVEGRIFMEETSPSKFYLRIGCKYSSEGACRFPVWLKAAVALPGSGHIWNWDGNKEQPTITPSIDCLGGCKRHWTITKGVAS